MKLSSPILTLIVLLCTLVMGNASIAVTEANGTDPVKTNIVVTIKPLYSLVSMLTAGTGDNLFLLMQQSQSPHHYNMKPSERRLLAKADMIVWIGPGMENFLDKILARQNRATVVTAADATGVIKLKRHTSLPQHPPDDHEHGADTGKIDPHIWLSAHNAAAISRQIHDQLVRLNPAYRDRYDANLKTLLASIAQTRHDIAQTLSGKHQPYISYHDAFRYFSDENRLNYVNAVSFDEESGASLKHLRKVKAEISQKNIHCLVYQEPRPALVDRLQHYTGINAVALDPLGLKTRDSHTAWFDIMLQLARGFSDCLTPAPR